MVSSTASLFESLPTRPPTPPREISKAVDDAISFLDDSNEVDRLLNKAHADENVIQSPSELTPSSSQDNGALSNAAKRVEFSPHLAYYNIAQVGQSSSPGAQFPKHSPPAATNTKPLRSILKLSNAPPPTPDDLESKLTYFSPGVPGSFGRMLKSVVPQLAGSSRSSRLDAYLALNGALQHYEDVPDESAMLQQMGLFMQFLSRDIAWKDNSGTLDAHIVTQALKLTIAILFKPKLSEALDDDFKAFLLDRSITAIEQADIAKPIAKMHLSLLAQQRFHLSILTTGRAERILGALQTIEDRCSGNSVVVSRFVVYARLVERKPAFMLSKMQDWFEHVVHGMLSSIKEVRMRAIETCAQAGLSFGQQSHASKTLHEMFETEVEEGQTYCDFLITRLTQMTSDKEMGPYVPQIWSAVVLFFRSKRKPLETWPTFKPWLHIIQKCLNSSDTSVRYQATLAWNRMVFAIMPDSSTSKLMLSMLKVPLCSGMDKSGVDKFSKHVRQYALDSYYNLLHYGLRPGLSQEELDNSWEAFVGPVLSHMVRSNGKGRYLACGILHGLFCDNKGFWNINAALEPNPIKPEDLPKLDPKWVRSRLAKILTIVEPAIATGMRYSAEANAAVNATWNSLLQTIADAGNQEVKMTMDLKEAIALLTSMFRRVWNSCSSPTAEGDQHSWLRRYVSLIDIMLVSLGTSSFVEDILATTKEDSIEVAPTPSHRPSKHRGAPKSPMVILFGQFYHPPKMLVIDEAYRASALTLLERFVSSRPTRAASLGLLSRSLYNWTDDRFSDTQSVTKAQLWTVVANAAIQTLSSQITHSNGQDSQSLGNLLRSGNEILVAGFGAISELGSNEQCVKLYDALYDAAKTGAGDGGVVSAVMEPFAKATMSTSPSLDLETKLCLGTQLLQRKVWPKNRQSLDQAQKALWGVGLAPYKAVVFNPFEDVYSLVESLFVQAYTDLDDIEPSGLEAVRSFNSAALNFLESSPPSLLAHVFGKMQHGFVAWVEDIARKTSHNENVTNMVQTMWLNIVRLMESLPSKDSTLLYALEPLLTAGFSSAHKTIVNKTILFWNDTFGRQQSLNYPLRIEAVLRARLLDADISLPTFPESTNGNTPASLPEFFASQSQQSTEHLVSKLASGKAGDMAGTKARQLGVQSVYFTAKGSPNVQHNSSSSPATKASGGSTSSTPKARLRHDDSRIQFAPIDSSPLPPVDESQHLTERQREVKARQQHNAQLFPDLSSSPMAQSTALPRSWPKLIDFVSASNREPDPEEFGTPTGLPDTHGLASDDLPSSPTPSSTKDASQGAIDMDHDQDEEAAPQDPPSSPPQAIVEEEERLDKSTEAPSDHSPDDAIMDTPDLVTIDHQGETSSVEKRGDDPSEEEKVGEEPQTDEMVSATEYPSDSQLPTVQLHQEAEKAAERSTIDAIGQEQERLQQARDQVPSSQRQISEHQTSPDADPTADLLTQGDADEGEEIAVSRIENSLIEPAQPDIKIDGQPNDDSQKSEQTSKKRKRRASAKFTPRKRKQQAPLFQKVSSMWTSFVSGNDEADDDDMEDEIVVASSQIASSHAAKADTLSEPVGRPSYAIEESQLMEPTGRKRGRLRKSGTPTPSLSNVDSSRSLKRKASTLSNASVDSSHATTSFVKETPAPLRADDGQNVDDLDNITVSQMPKKTPKKGRVQRRHATAVVPSPSSKATKSKAIDYARNAGATAAEVDDASTQVATPERQLEGGQAAAASNRFVLTPRSILGRLKDALSDFKGMILGSQEERLFDDVLFELRRETHEAAHRGREQQQ